jgi:galactokinase
VALVLHKLQREPAVAERLAAAGMHPVAAAGKARLFARSAAALVASGIAEGASAIAFHVPGRIEVLGKHTDYAGGRSILIATEQGFCVLAVPRSDPKMTVADAGTDQRAQFTLSPQLAPRVGHWSNYPATVARRVARNFGGDLRGADVAFASDLPPAAGMSSSSALIVASFLVLSEVNELPARESYARHIGSREDLANYLGTVENGQSFGELKGDRGVGTFGGSEDHTAILCARPDEMVQYSYCPLRFERLIALPENYEFAVAVSGVVAEKTGDAMDRYNRTSRLAAAVAEVWRAATGRDDPHMAAIAQSSPEAAERVRDLLRGCRHGVFESAELLDRFEQFLAENEQIIPNVADELTGPALGQFGTLVDRSQAMGARRLCNQIPETIFLAKTARHLGAAAASAFGAGFGGSVWAMIRTEQANRFTSAWAERYHQSFPDRSTHARFLTTGPGPAAFSLKPEH